MPKLQFTPEEIKAYAEDTTHFYYEDAIKIAKEMRVHADGEYPEEAIEGRRPNEPLEVKNYRKEIWVPITEPTMSKVFSSLQKIRRSQDWSIQYTDGGDNFSKIAEEETLQEYTEKNYPFFQSVTNWVFGILLRKYVIDPNAVMLVRPLETIVEENEFLRPFAEVFDSENVIDFKEEDYAVLQNPLGVVYTENGSEFDGTSFYVVTTRDIFVYDQVDSKNNFELNLEKSFNHQLGWLPAIKLGGVVTDQSGNNFLYKSRLSGMLPELVEAVREYSDLQASKVLHIYPERWEMTNRECTDCKGTGVMPNPMYNPDDQNSIPTHKCGTCNGFGYEATGPYSKILVKPSTVVEGQQPMPNPPAGYVEKDVEIVRIQDEGVDKHLYKALAAINFEFLHNTPLNQSGTAKEVDKDELNNMVHSIAEDLVRTMDVIFKATALYRYQYLYKAKQILEDMVPTIPVPERFDLLSSTYIREELKTAKESKTNPILINAIELNYASKLFNTDPEVRDRLMLVLELDPLPNVSDDDKMIRLSNKGISLETYVLSCNIHEFVQQALDEDDNFYSLPLKQQKEKVRSYAKAQIEAAVNEIADQVSNQDNAFDTTDEPINPSINLN